MELSDTELLTIVTSMETSSSSPHDPALLNDGGVRDMELVCSHKHGVVVVSLVERKRWTSWRCRNSGNDRWNRTIELARCIWLFQCANIDIWQRGRRQCSIFAAAARASVAYADADRRWRHQHQQRQRQHAQQRYHRRRVEQMRTACKPAFVFSPRLIYRVPVFKPSITVVAANLVTRTFIEEASFSKYFYRLPTRYLSARMITSLPTKSISAISQWKHL